MVNSETEVPFMAQSLIMDCDENKVFYVPTWQRHVRAMQAEGGTKGQSRKTSKQSWDPKEGDLRMTNQISIL